MFVILVNFCIGMGMIVLNFLQNPEKIIFQNPPPLSPNK